MIISEVHDNTPIISGNVGEKSTFSIKASRQSFAILSSGLYKYKIRAIIRELSCNARDAMTAAGLEQNFYVHLPTKMEPEFIIKDSGLGLSHDDVMTLYTTYFESTKSTSNLFVGALGLGSKSPFCYTENFTVTSVKDGIRGVYSAFIGEDGFPSIIQLYSQSTDDHNGVEVRIPVDASDFSLFLKEAKSVYRWFDIKPDCNVNIKPENDLEIKQADHHTEVSGNNSIVVMGGVAYTFTLSEFVPTVPTVNFVFKLPIGAVDFLPSREGLQNTKKTKEAIVSEFNRVTDTSSKFIHEKVETIKEVYDKLVYLNSYDTPYNSYLKRRVSSEKFNGKDRVVLENMEKFNIEGFQYSQYIGKKTPKKFVKELIKPDRTVIFIHNDTKNSIKSIRETAPAVATVLIFTPFNKSLSIDMDTFQRDVLLGAKVLKTSNFIFPQKKVVRVPKRNPLKIYVAEEKKRKNHWDALEYKLVIVPEATLKSSFKFYAQLNSELIVGHPKIKASIKNIVAIVGITNIVFLKEGSKFDTKNLVNFFDYVDIEIKKLPKYYFNFSSDEYFIFDAIIRYKLNFHDDVVEKAIKEHKQSKVVDTQIAQHLQALNIKDPRIKYPTTIFERLAKKYDAINFNTTDSKTIQLLIDTINNQKEKA